MKTRNRFGRTWLVAVLATACANEEMPSGNDDDADTGGNEGIFSVSNSDDDDDDGNSFDEEGSGSSTTSDFIPTNLNCDKIDFVFVIDNSSSMADEQQHLADAVPGFVDAMRNQFPTIESFRVGVVDTDSYPAVGSGKTPLEGCPADTEGIDCTSCDYQLGAFLTKPTSATDPTASCNFSTGVSYMDGESATFTEEFTCAAIVGTVGNPIEQQSSALLAAVDPAMSAEGECNAGFLRDDALLVFLMITDEEDDHKDQPAPQGGSLGEPTEWYSTVVTAKEEKATNIVALGLIGGSPRFPDCTALSQDGNGAEQSSRLESFIGSFETNFIGSVCTEGYDAFFATALEKVAEGCSNFIP
jgi:hypothetical protein